MKKPAKKEVARERFEKVLLADSEDSTNDLLAQIFSRECLAKEVFSSCQRDEQSELLIKHSPELLITDVADGGLGTIRSAREKNPEIRIVALSGFPKKEFEEEVIEAGADIYLEKPVKKEEIIEVVNGLL